MKTFSRYLHFKVLVVVLQLLLVSANSPPSFDEIPGSSPTKYYDMDRERFREDIKVGEIIYTLIASDPDGNCITFGVQDGSEYFDVSDQNCTQAKVELIKAFDYETSTSVSATWTLDDGHNDPVETDITVYIVNVNDHEPEFIGAPYVADVDEDTAEGTVITTVTVVDNDVGSSGGCAITITNLGDYAGMFYINSSVVAEKTTVADIYLTGSLDFEILRVYTLDLFAEDFGTDPGPLNSTATLYVNVKDVQDMPPQFLGLPYFTDVAENQPVNTSVMEVFAIDGDRGVPRQIYYEIVSEDNETDSFWVDTVPDDGGNNIGIIYTSVGLDREAEGLVNGLMTLNLSAIEEDSGDDPIHEITTFTQVTITVLDENDEAPYFDQTSYSGSIHENSQNELVVNDITMIVIDPDSTLEGASFNLSIINNDDASETFYVDPEEAYSSAYAVIRVKNPDKLDYEITQKFEFQVLAYEHESDEGLSSTANVTVSLLDMNDNSPVFSAEEYIGTVDEHSPEGTSVLQLNATDADSGTYGEVTYGIQGNNAEMFFVDSTTGVIYVSDSDNLDRESSNDDQYRFIGAASDGGGRTSTTEITVNVGDINDNGPEFLRDLYEGFVEEEKIETDIVTVSANDKDIDENAEIVYSIVDVEPQSMSFFVNSSTGVIGLIDTLDYDTMDEKYEGRYMLTVMAQDGGNPPLNSTTEVSIGVEGINDNQPVFSEPLYTASISELASDMDYVVTVFASDLDASWEESPFKHHSIIDYRIVSGSGDKFSLIPTSGPYTNVTVAPGVANLDPEQTGRDFYDMVLSATDRGNNPLYNETSVQVKIIDINNKPPVFDLEEVVESLLEDVDIGTEVTTMSATDPDENADLFYNITNIGAINERGEDVSYDEHGDNLYINQFRINETTGTVYVNELLDREKAEVFHLDIMVTDLNAVENIETQFDEATLEVRVEDVNDNEPHFQNMDGENYYYGTLQEENIDVVYPDVTAEDPDKGTNGDVEYYIVENSTGHLTIDKETGDITLNYEVDREEYEWLNITVGAMDKGNPPLNSTAAVYFQITDINDNAPVFTNLENETEVLENATIGTPIFTVSATDDDIGNNAFIVYSITAGDEDKMFYINMYTGVVYVNKSLDRETTDKYLLSITASDNPGGSSHLQSTDTLTVTILDVNDEAPEFTDDSYKASVREDEIKGHSIITVIAIDNDLGDGGEVVYSFNDDKRNDTYNNDDWLFGITVDGTVRIAADSLLNQQGVYVLEVIASDLGTPSLSSPANLTIEVTDVNNNPPVFVKIYIGDGTVIDLSQVNETTVHLPENHTGYVCTVLAEDYDDDFGVITYSFRENAADPYESWTRFTINDKDPANITITEYTDRERIAEYSLLIVATDNGDPIQLSSELGLQIVIDDANDNPPVFERDEEGCPIPDIIEPVEHNHSIITEPIGTMEPATDADIGENAVNYYFIIAIRPEGNEDKFRLNKSSGDIFALEELDREDVDTYELVVKAHPNPDYAYTPSIMASDQIDWSDTTLQCVEIDVTDINDNAPEFTKDLYTAGVATSAEYGSRVTRVEANDPDDDINGIVRYVITDQICEVDDQPNVCQDENGNPKDPFTLDPLDGTIYTNIVFEPGWTGYFDLKISAFDIDNKTDDTQLSIYLLRDDQRVKIVVYDEPDDVVTWIDDFMAEIENITGALCSADSIQTHVDRNNEPNSDMTDIYIHCVDPETNEIMDVQEIIYLLDTYEDNLDALFEEYNVVAIVPAVVPDNTVDTNAYIQIATGILLIVALFLLFLLIYCYCSMRSRYQRKLRAARAGGNLGTGENELKQNPLQVPGTNQYKFEGSNPIWNTPEMDIYSEVQEPDKNSLDENEVSDDANSEDQEVTVDLYNDDYDYYNKLPPEYAESDEFLDAALGELEKHKIGLDLDDMEITAV